MKKLITIESESVEGFECFVCTMTIERNDGKKRVVRSNAYSKNEKVYTSPFVHIIDYDGCEYIQIGDYIKPII